MELSKKADRLNTTDELFTEDEKEILRELGILDEPAETPDKANSVWFRVRFPNGGKLYTYVATKMDGTWFASGSLQVGFSWERLIYWIVTKPEWEIWHVGEYEFLASSFPSL